VVVEVAVGVNVDFGYAEFPARLDRSLLLISKEEKG
jgi:hypothetical protein